jgi:uncharacterized membrane protein
MKKVTLVVTIVTLFAVFYQAAPFIGVADEFIFAMFFISPFLVLYMAYVIMKFGKPSGHTFDEKFYDDVDYRRNGKEEPDAQS